MSDLIRREDTLRSIEEWYAKICKPETITELGDILARYSAYKDILKIPTADAVEIDTIKAWLYEIAGNNLRTEKERQFSEFCEEIISRLYGLRNFAKDHEAERK